MYRSAIICLALEPLWVLVNSLSVLNTSSASFSGTSVLTDTRTCAHTLTCLHLYIVPLVSVDAAQRPALTVARLPQPLQGPWIHKCFITLVQTQIWHTRNLCLLFQPKKTADIQQYATTRHFWSNFFSVKVWSWWVWLYVDSQHILNMKSTHFVFHFCIFMFVFILQWEFTVFGSMTRATVNASHSWWSSK